MLRRFVSQAPPVFVIALQRGSNCCAHVSEAQGFLGQEQELSELVKTLVPPELVNGWCPSPQMW